MKTTKPNNQPAKTHTHTKETHHKTKIKIPLVSIEEYYHGDCEDST